ncbi:DUF4275 family protein [Neobacillus sp. FSL H8-0543]|uniref:DUF4275 family protein n=1 Tax=Neobacillus sp. FSL H8-0543 TaxID=2954672 RepID=UPI0031595881
MDIVDILESKKVKVIEIPKWGPYLRKQWENHFAHHLSDKEKKRIYLHHEDGLCGYLWHLFSYEKKDSLREDLAESAFDREPKDACYIFYQHSDYAVMINNASKLAASDLENEEDIYVVDKSFSWTYVKTHETGLCGPYFSRNEW